MRKLLAIVGVVTIQIAVFAGSAWLMIHLGLLDQVPPFVKVDQEVEDLIDQLYKPENKVTYELVVVPGGEILLFSSPMNKLMRLGDRARLALHRRLSDERIQNEVAIILGAVGDRTTVPLLIDAYPADAEKAVYFTYALTYLTGEPIGRSRWGSDCNPNNRNLWRQWWLVHGKTFVVPASKPNATWVPSYALD